MHVEDGEVVGLDLSWLSDAVCKCLDSSLPFCVFPCNPGKCILETTILIYSLPAGLTWYPPIKVTHVYSYIHHTCYIWKVEEKEMPLFSGSDFNPFLSTT